MSPTTVVGIDPGRHGAAFALSVGANDRWVPVSALRLPYQNFGKRDELDCAAVAEWISSLGPVTLVAVEAVGHRRNSPSAFADNQLSGRVGELVGAVKVLQGQGVVTRWRRVYPVQWYAAAGVKIEKVHGEKAADRKKRLTAAVVAFAKKQYPGAVLVPARCKSPHDGLVDALGLAHWAARTVLAEDDEDE